MFLKFTPTYFHIGSVSTFPPSVRPNQPLQQKCLLQTHASNRSVKDVTISQEPGQSKVCFFSISRILGSAVLLYGTMRDRGTVKILGRGETAIVCDEERISRAWIKLARVLRHAIMREFWLGFPVISVLLLLFFMFWQHSPWVGYTARLINHLVIQTQQTILSLSSWSMQPQIFPSDSLSYLPLTLKQAVGISLQYGYHRWVNWPFQKA